MQNTHEVTEILKKWREGDKSAAEHLFPLVYDELRRQAKYYLHRERSNHTLQPTENNLKKNAKFLPISIIRSLQSY